MFKICKIVIEGFHSPQKKVEYDFSEENVTIMYGENGCGKTTLLQILNAIFSRNEAVLFNNKVREVFMSVLTDGGEQQIRIRERARLIKDAEGRRFLKRIEEYDWTEMELLKEQKTLLLGVDRINIQSGVSASVIYDFINTQEIGRRQFSESSISIRRMFAEKLAEYLNYSRKGRIRRENIDFETNHIILNGSNVDISNMENIIVNCFRQAVHGASTDIQSALFATLSQVIERNEEQYDKEKMEMLEERLEEYYPLISIAIEEIPEGSDNEILKLIKGSDCAAIIEKCRENSYLCLLLSNIIQRIDKDVVRFKAVLLLRDFFNEYTRKDKRMEISREGITIEILDGEEVVGIHRLNELSSGEKQLVTLLTCLFIDGGNRDLIFIDEPELSLNMRWQNELINLFEKYLPDTQVIMATHSPSIAEGHTNCLRKLV